MNNDFRIQSLTTSGLTSPTDTSTITMNSNLQQLSRASNVPQILPTSVLLPASSNLPALAFYPKPEKISLTSPLINPPFSSQCHLSATRGISPSSLLPSALAIPKKMHYASASPTAILIIPTRFPTRPAAKPHTLLTHTQQKTAAKGLDPARDPIKAEINYFTKDKHVMTFSGFSGLGYKDIDALKTRISADLDKAIAKHGGDKLCVVAGATGDGIGIVYQLAKERNIKTIGLVSEHAQKTGSLSQYCDNVIFIKDPQESWKVLAEDGSSYMVHIAMDNTTIARTGEFFAYGGGAVTLSELEEAQRHGIETHIYTEFDPDPQQAAERRKQIPGADLTPVRTIFAGKK